MTPHANLRLSIIITNYNYSMHLTECIESALAVRWQDKEVILVDDGSTDGSSDIIMGYRHRITPVFKPNGGQPDAANVGFSKASGEVIIFLDSDDVLIPDVMDETSRVWTGRVAKVQYPLRFINEDGERIRSHWPHYTEHHTTDWVKRSFQKTFTYEAPPTSGNAWSRSFLQQVFPLPTNLKWFDVYLHMLAPYYGDVVSLTSPHGYYRLRKTNWPELETKLRDTLRLDHLYYEALNDILLRQGKIIREIDFGSVSFHHCRSHLLCYLLFPDLRQDSLPKLAFRFANALIKDQTYSVFKKAIYLAWTVSIVTLPRPAAKLLIERVVHNLWGSAGKTKAPGSV